MEILQVTPHELRASGCGGTVRIFGVAARAAVPKIPKAYWPWMPLSPAQSWTQRLLSGHPDFNQGGRATESEKCRNSGQKKFYFFFTPHELRASGCGSTVRIFGVAAHAAVPKIPKAYWPWMPLSPAQSWTQRLLSAHPDFNQVDRTTESKNAEIRVRKSFTFSSHLTHSQWLPCTCATRMVAQLPWQPFGCQPNQKATETRMDTGQTLADNF
ncbi:MAG: hypothetical protein Q7K57_44185 [Burkholderiaceae bacterium]|nr:hypothetical protein [Burkholderiaceae bacterium]